MHESASTDITPMLSPRFHFALAYASQLHATQARKGTTIPYAAHLLGVASLVLEHGGSENQAIAALLHDAAEDCGGTARLQEIRGMFGDEVAGIVEACTDSVEDPKPAWKPRKEAYLARLGAKKSGDAALLVSLADKVHNARAIVRDHKSAGDAVWKRFTAQKHETSWYYKTLAGIFSEITTEPLADELRELAEEIATRAGL